MGKGVGQGEGGWCPAGGCGSPPCPRRAAPPPCPGRVLGRPTTAARTASSTSTVCRPVRAGRARAASASSSRSGSSHPSPPPPPFPPHPPSFPLCSPPPPPPRAVFWPCPLRPVRKAGERRAVCAASVGVVCRCTGRGGGGVAEPGAEGVSPVRPAGGDTHVRRPGCRGRRLPGDLAVAAARRPLRGRAAAAAAWPPTPMSRWGTVWRLRLRRRRWPTWTCLGTCTAGEGRGGGGDGEGVGSRGFDGGGRGEGGGAVGQRAETLGEGSVGGGWGGLPWPSVSVSQPRTPCGSSGGWGGGGFCTGCLRQWGGGRRPVAGGSRQRQAAGAAFAAGAHWPLLEYVRGGTPV